MKWKPVDWVVLILASAVAFIFVGVLARNVLHATELGEAQANILAGIIGSVTAIISLYVGSKVRARRDDE